jgi:hypothetical protein
VFTWKLTGSKLDCEPSMSTFFLDKIGLGLEYILLEEKNNSSKINYRSLSCQSKYSSN